MYVQQNLVRDGSLVLSVDELLKDLAGEWMPSLPETSSDSHPLGASIRIDSGTLAPDFPLAAPSLILSNVTAWISESRSSAWLANSAGTLHGAIDLEARIAHIALVPSVESHAGDVTSMLTIAAALLLVRDGRTAIHAGAVVNPDTAGAWLLVGDTHTGKSTTTANLIKSGWSYLSDDYVVLSRADGDSIEAEGWPDDFHLDEGWQRGVSTGVRGIFREEDLPDARRLLHAPVEGVLFTRVSANESTQVTAVQPVFALERLIRQSPWLVADSSNAGRVFDLLRDVASLHAGEIRVGLDTFADPARLGRIVSDFAAREDRAPGAAYDE